MAEWEIFSCKPAGPFFQVISEHPDRLPYIATVWVVLFCSQLATLRGTRFEWLHGITLSCAALLLLIDDGHAFFQDIPWIFSQPVDDRIYCAPHDGASDLFAEDAIATFIITPLIAAFAVIFAYGLIARRRPDETEGADR